MATHKVIQDIEAEDKFVGPLTLRQFIYVAIFVVCGYISFIFISKHVWFLMLPLLPIMLLSGFLGFPWGRDQPTEVWLLAKIRFYFKPRRRIWDQTGLQELVTVTAPKKIEAPLTKDFSQTEVRSRLKALADTIDSRGWVMKDVSVNEFTHGGAGAAAVAASSDRLLQAPTVASDAPITDIGVADDMMDEANNPTAQKLDQMIANSAKTRRQELLDGVEKTRNRVANQGSAPSQPQNGSWFMDPAAVQSQPAKPAISGVRAAANDTPAAKKPAANGAKKSQAKKTQASSVTRTPDPDILKLAINNDRNVASLAREATANRTKEPPDEVVISLH